MPYTFANGPTITVQCGFSANPMDSSVVWTDITAYVRKVHIHRGRSRELDSFGAGTCSVVCSNSQRTFDPEYTAGPYYGFLLPMKPIQIISNYASTTYSLFTGFVDGWPQSYSWNADSVVEVTATDGQKILANIDLPGSLYEFAVASDKPDHWWKLDESSGTKAFDTGFAATRYDGTYVSSPTMGTTSILTYGGGATCVAFTSASQQYVDVPVSSWSSMTASGSVEGWFRVGTVGASIQTLFIVGYPASALPVAKMIVNTAHLLVGGINFANQTTASVDDGAAHHFVSVWTGTTTSHYVDGALITSAAASTLSFAALDATATFTFATDFVTGGNKTPSNNPYNGALQSIALWNSVALSATQVASHYNTGKTAATETTGARMGRVFDYAGWPTSNRSIDTGSTTLAAYDLSAQTALNYAQLLAKTEDGAFFFLGNGNPRFIGRGSFISSTIAGNTNYVTSQATFGDAAGELEYAAFTTQYDDQEITNEARVTRQGGVEQFAADSTSQTSYGRRTISESGLLTSNDNEAADRAKWRVIKRKDPYFRVKTMTIKPRGPQHDPTLMWPEVLGLDLLYKITVNRRPQGVGTLIGKDVLIQSIDHEFGADLDWTTTFELSPASSEQQWLILNDTTYGKLNTGKLAY